jgi:methionyl-tRNA formyltransferase
VNVIFFGNSEGVFSNRHFRALMDSPCHVAAVVDVPAGGRGSTNVAAERTPGFVEMARGRKIPVFAPENPNSPGFLRKLCALEPDLLLAVGYTQRLRKQALAVPRLLAANFHASLLPAYRGKHPVFWALRHGERFVGMTVHVMDEGLDTGDILYQVRVRTRKTDTVGAAYDRVMDKSVGLVRRLVEDVAAGRLKRTPQSRAGASYFSSTSEDDFRIDWRREAAEICRWIRTSPGQCFFDPAPGRRVWLADAEVAGWRGKTTPGTVLRVGRIACTMATGRDALRLRRGRTESHGQQPMSEIIRDSTV